MGASVTEHGCRLTPAGSRPPARAHQGPQATRPVPAAYHAGRLAQTVAAGGGLALPVVLTECGPWGAPLVTATRARAATSSSPRPLGQIARLRDQRPHPAAVVVIDRSGERDQGPHSLGRATVNLNKSLGALHADDRGMEALADVPNPLERSGNV
ncbi:MAG: hypothetical protein RLZZ127_2580 [Planctomycetota bacterium]